MGKEEFKDIPDDIKKRIIIMGILAGKDLTVIGQRITINDSKIKNSIRVHSELAEVLDIEEDIQENLNQTRDAQYKLTNSILEKFQKMAESIGFNIVEKGEWPDKPTSFKIKLERGEENEQE